MLIWVIKYKRYYITVPAQINDFFLETNHQDKNYLIYFSAKASKLSAFLSHASLIFFCWVCIFCFLFSICFEFSSIFAFFLIILGLVLSFWICWRSIYGLIEALTLFLGMISLGLELKLCGFESLSLDLLALGQEICLGRYFFLVLRGRGGLEF